MEKFYHTTARGDFRPILRSVLLPQGEVQIAVGYISRRGIRDLAAMLDLTRIEFLVFGHPGPEDLRAAEELYALTGPGKVFIHPGFASRREAEGGPRPFHRPMLHSKIFLNSRSSSKYSAFVGSVNITGYALEGSNAEAGVVFVGSQSDPSYDRIRSALSSIRSQSLPFDPTLTGTYLSWYRVLLRELDEEAEEAEHDLAPTVSVIALPADFSGPRFPIQNEALYFEVPPQYIDRFPRIDQDVDLWLYPKNSPNAPVVLAARTTTSSLTGQGQSARGTLGGRVGTFQDIDWIIKDLAHPVVEYYGKKPSPQPSKAQQVVLTIRGRAHEAYGVGPDFPITYSPIRTRPTYPILEVGDQDPREDTIEEAPDVEHQRTSIYSLSELRSTFELEPAGGWLPIKSLSLPAPEPLRPLDFTTIETLNASASKQYQTFKLEDRSEIIILRRVRPFRPRLPGWTEKGQSRQSMLP